MMGGYDSILLLYASAVAQPGRAAAEVGTAAQVWGSGNRLPQRRLHQESGWGVSHDDPNRNTIATRRSTYNRLKCEIQRLGTV